MPYSTDPKVGGELLREKPGMGGWKPFHIRERVTGTGYLPSLTLSRKQPAKSKITWMAVKAAGAVGLSIGSSATAPSGNVGVALVATAPTSLATGATTANLALINAAAAVTAGVASIADNSAGRGIAPSAATGGGVLLDRTLENPATTPRDLHILPYMQTVASAQATQRFQVATGTAATVATTGYCFGTSTSATTTFDVQIYGYEYEDPAD